MERWQFIQSPAGSWYWLCSDVLSRKTRTSAATFNSRTECMADAMASGYGRVAPAARQAESKRVPRRRRSKRG
jgi:hypothetical protein